MMSADNLIAHAVRDPVNFMETYCGTYFHDLPEGLRDGYARYWCLGVKPGDFLCAVIKSDLLEAFGRADHLNRERMFDIVRWFYNQADSACMRGNFEAWCMKGGYLGPIKAKEVMKEQRNGSDIL